ncbi:hypothetical protein SAMN05444413_109101 [Roseivivax marinus]|uniref:HlyU family transcriptional regulator n=1 Tax=Roseivivax marinus TaxID=1379903 RepID=UPI0008BB4068|nr:HlyU family transcriptional regulator [Roseivivax marinus]SEL46006.1 hypothetical protein SAMN05444413_109101 [Roseivivax marinus]
MSLFSKLFGGGGGQKAAPAADPVEYKGFRITPAPLSEEGGFRLAAKIEGPDGQEHQLVRADLLRDRDEAEAASVAKAQQLIDQMGVRLFD